MREKQHKRGHYIFIIMHIKEMERACSPYGQMVTVVFEKLKRIISFGWIAR
jgi:hypothetical protein